jgi:hypothetical protein
VIASWRAREALIGAIVLFAAYTILHEIAVVGSIVTDFGPHVAAAEQHLMGELRPPGHPLFMLTTAWFSRLTGAAAAHSAAILIAASIAASAVIIDRLYLAPVLTGPADRFAIGLALVVAALVATAVWYPPPTPILIGQSSPNVWHNPTGMLQKPFALLAAIGLERIIFGTQRGRIVLVTAVAVILSMLAKPAFAMVMLPTLTAYVLYLSLPKRWQRVPEHLLPTTPGLRSVLLVLLGVTAALLIAQTIYIYMYDRSWVKIIFAPLAVWSRQSFNIPRSILLAVAFPLAVTILDLRRGIPLAGLALAWMFALTGIAIFALLAEGGRPMLHGNFGWSYQIALSVLFAFSMRSYLRHWSGPRTWGFAAVSLVLAAHVITGVYYLYRILALHDFK